MLRRVQYSLDVIQEEARRLVCQGILKRHQPIYMLCKYFPAREWGYVERELERNDFLLRDSILDLLGSEDWCED
ncbi:DUF4327 family protein (plasmid) [Kovacikia minuta CCNUW1]|uniref:DUF4327 family protein n=1 Tax=Kovacikia minuta TaxID=2931930 RepID=UPI001CD00EF3|nr:DUF4327 family protein [Kovacikia minuta]UBF30644.1 DUF4327 family protein [Kovacikia minuta CCNUW1]